MNIYYICAMIDYSQKQSRVHGFKNELIHKSTKSEIAFKDALQKHGIPYHFQKMFYNKDFSCIVDFYINAYGKSKRIVVEIDGDYHNDIIQQQKDEYRTKWLQENRKCKVVRFTNNHVMLDVEYCIKILKLHLSI